MVKVKEATLYCGNKELENAGNHPMVPYVLEELQRAKNAVFLIQKCLRSNLIRKGTLKVSQGEGCATLEVKLICGLTFSAGSNQGKLTVMFLKKVKL